MTFRFNDDYDDETQVAEFYDDYLTVRAALDASGAYAYNARLMGKIPGIAGEDEDVAIYLLQGIHARLTGTTDRPMFEVVQ